MEIGRVTAAELPELARTIRIGSLVSIFHAGSGHPGGSLSAADILAFLLGEELRGIAGATRERTGDRFVLSKGHACPALYAAAAQLGLVERRELVRLRKLGSPLQGHPHVLATPWVETSTGSLGQGFSFAVGAAAGLKLQGLPGRVHVMLGDGELQEGEVWEAAMFAAHRCLDNLCAVIDYNKMQSDDWNRNIVGLEPLAAKWMAFGWRVIEADGHAFDALRAAFAAARAHAGAPAVIIAHTHKGRGVSFMEGSPLWHGSVKLRPDELRRSLAELAVEAEVIEQHVTGAAWEVGDE